MKHKNPLLFKIIALFILLIPPQILITRQIDTFYGPIEVEEPVLLELIDSPPFQRLKHIHQYGISYYTTHPEEYNRYNHSLGVFAILRAKGASLEEQIAGLLHDVSHTAFSHVGDWIFGKECQESDYQNSIHLSFLEKSGLSKILETHAFTAENLIPQESSFPALENTLPNLCADRIDYNIQGAYYQRFITHEEALEIFYDLQFIENRWISTLPELMKKLTRFSLFMTIDCWGSLENYLTSRWLADAILRAIDLQSLSYDNLHFGTDQEIWDKLLLHEDPVIQQNMNMIANVNTHFLLVDHSEADFIIKSKFRGINPWIYSKDECVRLTSIDADLACEYETIKQIVYEGWPVKIRRP